MKISYITNDDYLQFKNLWKEAFAFDDGGFTNFFFEELYDKAKHYVLKEGNKLISAASRFEHDLVLNGKLIRTSMIVGVATFKDYQRQGYMSALMKEILNQSERQELLTMIQAYNPEIYKKYGFEIIYHRNEYHFNRYTFNHLNTDGISNSFKLEELLFAYKLFTKYFNGYYKRDIAYYKNYLKELIAQDHHIAAVYSNNHIRGYFTYYFNKEEIVIDECVYMDTKTLTKIISYALKLKENARVVVSEYERLDKIYPYTFKNTLDYTMCKINDFKLFNELYDLEVSSTKEAFEKMKKPLFMREAY